MIRIKTIKLNKWGVAAVTALCIIVLSASIKGIHSNQSVRETFSSQSSEAEHVSGCLVNDLLKAVIDKALPVMRAGGKKNNDRTVFSSLIRMVTRKDYKDPTHLIIAELPIMGHYNLSIPNRGNAAGTSRDSPSGSDVELKDILSQYKPTDAEAILGSGQHEREDRQFKKPARVALNMAQPTVLIYHTHTSEAYKPSKAYNYTPTDVDRTTDVRHSVVRVGKELKDILESKYDIKTVHVTAFHDYPEFTPAYSRSLNSVRRAMEEYPSVKVIIDLHRDGFPMRNAAEERKAREVSVIKIDGQDTARLLLVWGPDAPNSTETRKFAELLKNKINEQHPGLCRGVLEKETGRYNQQLSDYSALIEVGSNVNTMEEALRAVPHLAKSISETVKEVSE